MKNELYGGRLMSAGHPGKPAENGKACEGHTTETSLPYNYLPL